jgi:2-polyprenyl-3-methyl-5-hydroxy-6-metoxy-1,4-benzoquinol methylase
VSRQPAKFQAADFDAADDELSTVLHSLEGCGNYTAWICDLAEPHLGADVLEVGAGHGTITARLRDRHRVTATDVSSRAVAVLHEKYDGDPQVTVAEAHIDELAAGAPHDSVLLVNVLEHIDDDVVALRTLRSALVDGGSLILYVPAFAALYSRFDHAVGHHRRYTKRSLRAVVEAAGYDVVDCRYVNSVGALAWWLFAKVLRQTPTQDWSARLYDRFAVPVLRRVEARWRPPFGQSVFLAAVKASG